VKYILIRIPGRVRPDLFTLQDEDVPIQQIVDSTQSLLGLLDDKQKEAISYHVDSPQWRTWSNPEFPLAHKGVRLDEVNDTVRNAAMNILKVTLSPEGYEKAVAAMRINHFLGELVKSTRVMNEFSYNFVLFGHPSTTRPWGWSFYGHHLCLNIFLYKGQIVASPWFTGAEPNEIDVGPYAGTRTMQVEETLGLELMQSLSAELQSKAQVFEKMKDPTMPPGRWNKDEQRHLCGAYRDNREVPYEGILASTFSEKQKELMYSILEQCLLYLPAKPRALKLEQMRRWRGRLTSAGLVATVMKIPSTTGFRARLS
jgi:Protein of unknown function (DUF3500).